jgi:hypothetical protein
MCGTEEPADELLEPASAGVRVDFGSQSIEFVAKRVAMAHA